MIEKLGRFIVKHPWLVIISVLIPTLGFGSLLPKMEMQTSMENFLPNNEVIQAQNRIDDYFGADFNIIMVYVQKQNSKNVLSTNSLKELYLVGNELKKREEVYDVLSIASFVDYVCQMEFENTLDNCSDEEIKTAYLDLMTEKKEDEKLKFLETDDPNEKVDYNYYPKLSKGKSLDYIDIKNYYISEINDSFCFSIEVYDLNNFESNLRLPESRFNVYEWFIDFKNLINSNKEYDMDYRLSAHIEPSTTLWEICKGPLNNLRDVFEKIVNKKLFNSFKKEAILWIKQPNQDFSVPIKLESGNITFDNKNNTIEITVDKLELGNYGIAPVFGSFESPGRIGRTRAGFRYYHSPIIKRPWSRLSVNLDFIRNSIKILQNRSILNSIFSKIMEKYVDFTFEDLNGIFSNLENNNFEIDSISLKDFSTSWTTTDLAPNKEFSDNTYFIKPMSFKEMRKSVFTFLSDDYFDENGAKATLMMIQVDGSLPTEELLIKSEEIVYELKKEDDKKNYVTMRATGNSVIEYEINDVTMDANGIVIPLIFIVIFLILFISFRGLSYVVISLFGLSIAIIWLFGTMVLFDMPFMIMEVALIPMLMGLGVDYSVHIFHNYRIEISNGKKPREAIVISIFEIGTAMLLATITTSIAFLSFITVSMIPLRDFGVLCGLGIAYVFIVTITFQAALRFIIDRRKKAKNKLKKIKDPDGKIMRKIANIVCKHPLLILLVTLLITGAMIIGFLNIKTGFDMEDFLPEENPSVIVMDEITNDFPFSTQDKEYILIEGEVATVQALVGISKTIENLKDDKFVLYTIDDKPKTNSILDLISKAVDRNNTLSSEFNIDKNGIPRTDSDVKRLYDYLYESEMFFYEINEVLHKNKNNYDATTISIFTDTTSQGNENVDDIMKTIYNEFNEDINEDFGNSKAVVTGQNSMMHVIMSSMTESQILSTAICIILAAIVLIIAYRKLVLGLITMIPVSFSTIWIVGTMHFIGFKLNVMTIMITSLTIGLGITYAIHAVERFRLTADSTGDVIKAVSETIGHTGGALLIAAITTIVGFGMLVLVPMPIEQQFGLITALTILYAFLTSIFILPPVLLYWGKWRIKHKGFIISKGKPKEIDEKNKK